MRQGLCSDVAPGRIHAKVASRYVEEFHDVGMSRVLTEAVWARYKADGTDLKYITSLVERRAFVQNMDNERTSDATEGIVVEKEGWGFEGIVSAEKIALSDFCGKLQES